MWRRYKGRCLPACNALGECFKDGFRAAGTGSPIRSLNCYDSYQLMNSSVSPGKTPFLYFESKYPAFTRWPIFALRIDDGDTWHTPVYSTTMVSPPYFWLSSRLIVVVSASSSMSVSLIFNHLFHAPVFHCRFFGRLGLGVRPSASSRRLRTPCKHGADASGVAARPGGRLLHAGKPHLRVEAGHRGLPARLALLSICPPVSACGLASTG